MLVACWTLWSLAMAWYDHWHLFIDGWVMSVTMAFGSFIAGSTSEGGGAIAFPVMTLVFEIEPAVARDFALMIQSVGMGAAALTIGLRRSRVEPTAILCASAGGAIGIVIGIEQVAPLLASAPTKMFFVALWLSFGVALLWMNRQRSRVVFDRIQGLRLRDGAALLTFGLIGGTVSGITGSGLDIVTFSLLVLTFGISEKVATPTSVVLMAVNAIVGFAWRSLFSSEPISAEAWHYWWVSVPVVVLGAPLGAKFIARRPRFFIVVLLLSTIGCQFVGAMIVLPSTRELQFVAAATFAAGLILFFSMAALGRLRWRQGPFPGDTDVDRSSIDRSPVR